MKKNLIPVALFCVVFLAYFLYLVKVVHINAPLEQNSIAKSVKRAMDKPSVTEMVPEKMVVVKTPATPATIPSNLQEPIKRYVNYTWLNVRKEPSLSSPVIEKVLRDDELIVMSYPSSSWAYVKTNAGTNGYVASRYLSEKPTTTKTATTPSTATPVKTPVAKAPVVKDPVVVETGKTVTYDIPTITYHHITDETGFPKDLTLAMVNFLAQLHYLEDNKFKTYTFHDLKKIKEGTMKPEKGVILTFNGGYKDAYIASQHINGMSLKAVFFITTEKVGTPGYLDWREIKMMRSWGMEIASSGIHGVDLTQSSDFYMKDELVTSKKTIEDQLGDTIITFAYPSGRYNAATMKAVEDAGYVFARTTDNGSRYTETQLYSIPTLRVFPLAGKKQFQAWLGK